ncbi:hypothetical protein NLX83_21440 [Allokutzneria sp. A3M-2-11 16]|uniref:hypothetical protein n=1 Tax=Allokutzneria sp. A3M-2-11 16 TaxID=2962043 RepID=UPI0020B6D8C0|nr:hypothetical protein [Allokutzneria sp. A3M-2-11 16]MCP3801833.1 hypothetical protein [Allokutzneria sp. A3M-2-11 16]
MDGLRVRVDDTLTTATLAMDQAEDGLLVLLVSPRLRFADPVQVSEFARQCVFVAEHNSAKLAEGERSLIHRLSRTLLTACSTRRLPAAPSPRAAP